MPFRKPALSGALLTAVLLGAAGCSGESTGPGAVCTEPGTICTYMGTGDRGFAGEAGTLSQVALYWPIELAFDSEKRLLVIDWNNLRIRRVDHDGRVRTVMGTGIDAGSEDGAHALETPLHHTFSMAYDDAGNLFLAGFHAPNILKVTPDWIVHIIAGSDETGYDGDGGDARAAALDSPCGVAVPPSGSPVYFADTYNHCLRTIDAEGIIRTVAGDGTPGYSGEDVPALEARLQRPFRVRYDASSGGLIVCDTMNHVVRRISADGTIHTLAGTGASGFSGDGGPATEALLREPNDAKIGPDGALYIADTANHRIRRVGADGVIRTLVGSGVRGFGGDGGPVLEAALDYPHAFTFDDAGNLWIADTYNSRIRIAVGVLPVNP